MNFLLKKAYLRWSIFYIATIYALCALEHYQLLSGRVVKWLVHEQMLTNSENSFFEIFSAAAWFLAAILFFLMSRLSMKACSSKLNTMWFCMFFILSVFAFGEEISWGDHLFNYSHDSEIVKINAQKETNLHNINAALVLGVEQESFFYPYIKNFGYILTPLFYMLITFIWVLLPLIKLKTNFGQKALFKEMPISSNGLIAFFIIHAMVFVFIDVTLFNVGQVFEMFISLAAVIVALDMMRPYRIQSLRSENLKNSDILL